ncbi:MAG: TIGR01777 family oxidoreductase [Planctomycetota bacterium]
MKVLVTGGTGFVGTALVAALGARGDSVVVAGRSADRIRKRFGQNVEACEWDPMAGPLPADALDGVDAVVNLAGESVAKGRWTRAKKARIRESRVTGTRHLVEGIAAADSKPSVLVSTSAIGFYGDTGPNKVQEGSRAGSDFLADVCREWEAAARVAREAGVRVPIVRVGVILGRGGGAYTPLRRVFRCFLGGTIGLGKAWFSWIHLDDVVGIYLHCIDNPEAREVYNATAPNPVSNMEFTRELARSLRRPAIAPVPPLALRVVQGEFANHVTMSQRVMPLRTIGLGYEFAFPKVREALNDLA